MVCVQRNDLFVEGTNCLKSYNPNLKLNTLCIVIKPFVCCIERFSIFVFKVRVHEIFCSCFFYSRSKNASLVY